VYIVVDYRSNVVQQISRAYSSYLTDALCLLINIIIKLGWFLNLTHIESCSTYQLVPGFFNLRYWWNSFIFCIKQEFIHDHCWRILLLFEYTTLCVSILMWVSICVVSRLGLLWVEARKLRSWVEFPTFLQCLWSKMKTSGWPRRDSGKHSSFNL